MPWGPDYCIPEVPRLRKAMSKTNLHQVSGISPSLGGSTEVFAWNDPQATSKIRHKLCGWVLMGAK